MNPSQEKETAPMKTTRITISLLFIFFIATLVNAYAYSLRCGVRLITEGDYKAKVLAECGEPDHVEMWEEERIYKYYYKPSDDHRYHQNYLKPRYAKDYIIVEEWTYNHGRYRFMDHIRFENGRVRRIKSGDYGY
jgi:hypothetical protein